MLDHGLCNSKRTSPSEEQRTAVADIVVDKEELVIVKSADVMTLVDG